MKKVISMFLSIFLIITLSSSAFVAFANHNNEKQVTDGLHSGCYYMLSLDDGSVMFSKNEQKKVAPAAFVKLLGAVVATEKWGNLDEKVSVTEKNLSLVKYDYGVRTANLKVGEKYTKRKLIDLLIIYSANDAASIIAYEVSGSAEAFVNDMQELANKIGCKNTKITNIHGFDDDSQYTTAEDIAMIIRYALNYPSFSEAFCASDITLKATEQNPERTYRTSNRMLSTAIGEYYHSSVVGGKQTSTEKAGECIAVTTSRDGYSYLVVVMKGKLSDIDDDRVNENTCMTDAKRMLNWVYENIRFRVVATANQTVAVVKVIAGKGGDNLRLIPKKETSALVPASATSDSVLIEPIVETMPEKIMAPVSAGTVMCKARVLYAGSEITTIDLVAANDVGLSVVGLIMSGVASVLSSGVFIAFLVISLIVICAYIALIINKMIKAKKGSAKELTTAKKR